MANKEHLELLRKGVKEWNKWRKLNPDIEPDLSDTYLGCASLRKVNLKEAYSAMPTSALPTSTVPTSVVPISAMPTSAVPTSVEPTLTTPI